MPFQHRARTRSISAAALTTIGLALVSAGCSSPAPLGPHPSPASMPAARTLRSPITMQAMRAEPPTSAGACQAGAVALFGSEPDIPRLAQAEATTVPAQGATAGPTQSAKPPTPPTPEAGVACYQPIGTPVTVTFAQLSTVTAYPQQNGPDFYGFVIAFTATDIPVLTATVNQAFTAEDAIGLSVDGKLWQAPPIQHKANALRAQQINLLSKEQAQQLYHLLAPTG